MTSADTIWGNVVMAAGVISPGVLALFVILGVRSWMTRRAYRARDRRGRKLPPPRV